MVLDRPLFSVAVTLDFFFAFRVASVSSAGMTTGASSVGTFGFENIALMVFPPLSVFLHNYVRCKVPALPQPALDIRAPYPVPPGHNYRIAFIGRTP